MNRRDLIKALAAALPPVSTIATAKVESSDVIVIECERMPRPDTHEKIVETVQRLWPGQKVLVIGPGFHLRIMKG